MVEFGSKGKVPKRPAFTPKGQVVGVDRSWRVHRVYSQTAEYFAVKLVAAVPSSRLVIILVKEGFSARPVAGSLRWHEGKD